MVTRLEREIVMHTKLLKTLALLLLASTVALAKNPKLSRDLDGLNPTSTVNVIIQYKNPPSKDDLKQLGPYGQMKKLFHGINAVVISLQPAQLQTIASNPNVAFI